MPSQWRVVRGGGRAGEGGVTKSKPLLTMCLIGRNEAHNVDRCFASWWDAVDEVIYADTGSKDGTIEKARAFAKARGQSRKLKVKRFKWCEDFAVARNFADSFATGTWVAWCDLDDEIRGLDRLRDIAAGAESDVVAFFAHYQYAATEDGATISELWRERVVRNNGTVWEGRLHEHKVFTDGRVVQVGEDVADWVHHRHLTDQSSGHRNRRILEQWDVEEPDNPRIIHSLGLEYLGAGEWETAAHTFDRYLTFRGEQPDRRAQAARHRVQALTQIGRTEEAKHVAFQALQENWRWTDTHLSLAEIAQAQNEPDLGYHHAERALRMGKPNSILILNPLQYTAHPRAIMAVCCMMLGRHDEAMRLCQETLAICDYPLITAYLPQWQNMIVREQTVTAFSQLADLCRQHGELLKAVDLLNAVPYFAAEDQRLIGKRVEIAQAVAAVQRADLPLDPGSAAGKFVVRHVEEMAA